MKARSSVGVATGNCFGDLGFFLDSLLFCYVNYSSANRVVVCIEYEA